MLKSLVSDSENHHAVGFFQDLDERMSVEDIFTRLCTGVELSTCGCR